jgi:serine protease Do
LIHRSLSRSVLPLLLASSLTTVAFAAPVADPPAGAIPTPPTTQQEQSTLMQMQDAFTKIAQTVEPTVVNIKSFRANVAVAPPGILQIPMPTKPNIPRKMPKKTVPHGPKTAPKTAPKAHAAPPDSLLPNPDAPSDPDAPSAPNQIEATGSGVIVRADGYILTNDHVVDGAPGGTVTVTLSDGREFQGKVYPDFRSDLAVVKIDPGNTPLPVATFGDSNSVEPGQWAIAVGSPFDLQNTMTVGVISALNRQQTINGDSPNEERYYPDLIQTDAAINPGNSGGPLFNINGQVVGINVAIESPVEGSAGVGFAIPSDIAEATMNALISNGKVVRGQLGVVPVDLTPAMEETYGQKQGAFLSDVLLSSPAGKAGLQAADIVTSYNGTPIHGELDLRLAISATPPGTKVEINYVRNGSPAVATVTIGASPPMAENTMPPALSTPKTGAKFGLNVRDLNARDRVTLTLPPTTQGVLVLGAVAGSPADLAGLNSPDAREKLVIQRVNETPVTTAAEYEKAIDSVPAGSLLTLVVLSNHQDELHQSALSIQL